MGALPRRERILVVDDEPQLLIAFSDTLGDLFEVVTTSEPERALELAQGDAEFSVIVSDQSMPNMTGDELFHRLRQVSNASRVLVTGQSGLTAVVRAVNAGTICAFVTKPWQAEELTLKVRMAAEQFRLTRELRTSEERLRLAFRASNAGLFDWNIRTGEVVYSSKATDPAVGLADARGEFGELEKRIHADDLPKLRAAIEAHLAQRQPFRATEVRVPGDGALSPRTGA